MKIRIEKNKNGWFVSTKKFYQRKYNQESDFFDTRDLALVKFNSIISTKYFILFEPDFIEN